jgi:two-component system chemotaxis response regulator CheY
MASETSEQDTNRPNSANRRVLVVDDARTVRAYYRDILERASIEVTEAANGLEGLEKVAEALPDLLLVDINMPKMDGYAMLRAVRAAENTRSIPAIMISTEAEERDATRAYEAGANVYLVKPVRPEQLRSFAQLLKGLPLS